MSDNVPSILDDWIHTDRLTDVESTRKLVDLLNEFLTTASEIQHQMVKWKYNIVVYNTFQDEKQKDVWVELSRLHTDHTVGILVCNMRYGEEFLLEHADDVYIYCPQKLSEYCRGLRMCKLSKFIRNKFGITT